MKGLKQDIFTVKKLIEIKYPDLTAYLNKKEISIDNSLLTWMICLFTHADLGNEASQRIIEYIIVNKKIGLYKIIIEKR